VAIGRCDLALQRWLAELENGSGVATLQSCFMTPRILNWLEQRSSNLVCPWRPSSWSSNHE
jgi:hypothetical protein